MKQAKPDIPDNRMNRKKIKHNNSTPVFFTAAIVLGVLFLIVPTNVFAFSMDKWDLILKEYVKKGVIDSIPLNVVDYKRLKNDKQFIFLKKELNRFLPSSLKQDDEKISFWINVYNIFAIKMIADHYPVESIKDIGSLFKSVWKKKAGTVGGVDYTLGYIEHEILRKFKEPRIHAAIVCASVSCPDLREEAYTKGRLNKQLDDQMRLFLLNRKKGLKIDKKNNIVYLSSIFDWFKKDFKKNGGVIAALSKYVSNEDRAYFYSKQYTVKYFYYNWMVNEGR